MKYVSLDIETCGLDAHNHSMIQFGAIIEDTDTKLPYGQCPKFEVLLKQDTYTGTPFALAMHAKLFQELAKPPEKQKPETLVIKASELGERFALWLVINGMATTIDKPIDLVVAGKNVASFDKFWLEQNKEVGPGWLKYISIAHRVLDPGILFWNASTDAKVPSMEECKKRAAFLETTIAHTTLADSWDTIQLLRTRY
jgi:hypothetical protein